MPQLVPLSWQHLAIFGVLVPYLTLVIFGTLSLLTVWKQHQGLFNVDAAGLLKGLRAWWITVSTLAGVSEEITWRGVQTTLLAMAVGNMIVASIICAVMFGLAHSVQDWKTATIVGLGKELGYAL